MKYSKQRELILKTLENNVVHPTAEFIYEKVKKELPSISLATVYRNLNQLAENGDIIKIIGLDGSVRFDHNKHHHYHFVCIKCNKVYDIDHNILPNLEEEVLQKMGLQITNNDISFRGICKDCQTKH